MPVKTHFQVNHGRKAQSSASFGPLLLDGNSVPRYFQFVESFPLTASGKVQKFVLREDEIKALGLQDVAKTRTA